MRLRPLVKPVLNRVLPPLTRWYLRKPRNFRHDGLHIEVLPGVFHPGLFLSSVFIKDHLRENFDLKGKAVLEIGCGSGFVSIWSARAGANVTATDISAQALACARQNGERNGVALEWIASDLFEALPPQKFDLIVVNPPYYPGQPEAEADHAWLCGPEFEYFQRLFAEMGAYRKVPGAVRMVLSEDCALERIGSIATEHGWTMREVDRRKRWAEWNYIFEFDPK